MTDSPRPRDEAELIERIHSIDVGAPRQLHERIEAMVAGHDRRRGGAPAPLAGLRLRLGAAATALAATAAAIALALSGSGGAALTLAQASAVTLRPATMPAPAESRSHRDQLTAAVDGIGFPYWADHFGWRSAGARVDTLRGRSVKTVFYDDRQGNKVGYTIVAGAHPPAISGGGTVRWRSGTPYRLGRVGGVEVVTWKRDGHLCVVAGRGVDDATLFALASWDDEPQAA
jgi:hypothetical protein